MTRFGVKTILAIGMALLVLGLLYFTQIDITGSYLIDLVPGFFLAGVGLGFAFVPVSLAALQWVRPHEAWVASGLFNSSQQIGGALGLAILSTVAASQTTTSIDDLGRAPTQADQVSALVDGFQAAFAIGAGLMLLGVVLAATLIRRRDVAMLAEAPSVVPEA